MTFSKSPNAKLSNDFLRATNKGAAYTPQELETIVVYGLSYIGGLKKSREVIHCTEQAEAFRRKIEIIQIFRELPEHLRERPCGQTTKTAILDRLHKRGLTCSERTLMRDYRSLGGANWLRLAKPLAPEEDPSTAFEDMVRKPLSKL